MGNWKGIFSKHNNHLIETGSKDMKQKPINPKLQVVLSYSDVFLEMRWKFFRITIRKPKVQNKVHSFTIDFTLKDSGRIQWNLQKT